MHMCVFVSLDARNREGGSDPLEMNLQVVVSDLMWTLGTLLKSSGRAATVFQGGAVSLALCTPI